MDKEKDGVIVVKGKKVKTVKNDLLASMKTTQELCIVNMNKANQKIIKDKEMTNKTNGDYFDIMNAHNQMK
jgi:precorrin-2 methylase